MDKFNLKKFITEGQLQKSDTKPILSAEEIEDFKEKFMSFYDENKWEDMNAEDSDELAVQAGDILAQMFSSTILKKNDTTNYFKGLDYDEFNDYAEELAQSFINSEKGQLHEEKDKYTIKKGSQQIDVFDNDGKGGIRLEIKDSLKRMAINLNVEDVKKLVKLLDPEGKIGSHGNWEKPENFPKIKDEYGNTDWRDTGRMGG